MASEAFGGKFIAVELVFVVAVGMYAGHLREDIVAHDRCVRRNGYAAVALHQMRDVYQGTFVDRRSHVAHVFQYHMNGRQRSITATLA